jgi:hypothetical protein
MNIKTRAFWLVIVGGLLIAGSAYAHAGYVRSEPGDGAVIAAPPARVDLWFSQELFRRAGENWIRVVGPGEWIVHTGDAQIDDDDRKHLWVMLQPGLEPGVYRVEWRSLSAEDGDPDEGSFTFTLDPQAAATSTPMGMETPTASPTSSAVEMASTDIAPSPSPPTSEGGSCAPGLVPAAGLVGLVWLHRRRKPTHA